MADRKFNIAEYGPGFDLDTNDYDDQYWTLVPCPRMDACDHCGKQPRHLDSIFVAIDGACRGNGTPDARAAIGVYFAESSLYNISMTIPEHQATNQVSELVACWMALRSLVSITTAGKNFTEESDHPISQVVIKADSEYVVKGMTEWIVKWRVNGYRNHKGVPIKNCDWFMMVDDSVNDLKDLGVHVLFWHVPRERNKEADRLANAAFKLAAYS
ncbi:hypothetical protein MMC11_002706 [Xylographa trunciseda]|nr:hypothetical protein [Xylographa trunciseda]